MEYRAHYDYLCPKCAAAQDRRDQADRHLVSYLTVVLGPYKEHWAARGLTPLELADLLEGAANEVSEVMRDEGIKARDAAESE